MWYRVNRLAARSSLTAGPRWVGFTLIELLVVVAIIALLVAILVPTLSEANRIAKMTVCKNHLKQIALGINLYTNAEPRGLLPTFYAVPFPYEKQTNPSMFSVS